MLRIKKILKAKSMTQKELAKRIGKSEPNLNKILNGNPTISTLKEVADALEVNIRELFEISDRDEVFGYLEKDGDIFKVTDLTSLKDFVHGLDNQ